MNGAGTRGAALLVLLFVALSVCAADEASLRPHEEEPGECCAVTGCVVVAVIIASATPTALGTPLHPVAASALRSQTRRPVLPPPELASAQAA